MSSGQPVPQGWVRKAVGDLCGIAIGGTPDRRNPAYWDTGRTTRNLWASIRDLNARRVTDTLEYLTDSGVRDSSVKLVPAGTVLMSFKLTVGRVAFAGCDLYTNEAIAAFVPRNHDVDPAYLYYGLQGWDILQDIDQAVKGVTLNTEKLRNIPGLFPPLPEQRKIAAILSSVDTAIEKTEALIAKLRDLKTAMMQELLTKGIGHTRFKALGDWQLGRIAAIREIPESWQLVPIAEVARLESGHTPDRDVPEYWNGGVPWISLHDTKTLWQRVVHSTSMTVTADGIKNSSARLLPVGTVCLSRTASIGHCVIMWTVMATSQDFANYVCGERLHNRYLLHLFRSMGHTWTSLASGSTHQTVYMPIFEQLQILVPPLAEQLRIAAIADSLDDAVERRQGKLASLHSLKKALMQDLLTGRVRVTV